MKTLGEIHLIAITAVQIFLYLAKFFAVLLAGHIGLPVGNEREIFLRGELLAFQPGPTGIDIIMTQQRNCLTLVVNNQRPVVDTPARRPEMANLRYALGECLRDPAPAGAPVAGHQWSLCVFRFH